MKEGLVQGLKKAGAMIGSAGCAGCAEGQIGQNGPGEVTLTTGNRNFAGKQGKGEVYLASPQTVAASAAAGVITTAADLVGGNLKRLPRKAPKTEAPKETARQTSALRTRIEGRVWVIPIDNIDTDMIFHNRHLAITARAEMAAFAFGNLAGYENFASEVKPGDVVVVGKNFGAGSSRAQAVDCFLALGVSAIIAESFGAIYERNAINSGLPIMVAPLLRSGVEQNDSAAVDFKTGEIKVASRNLVIQGQAFSDVQLSIYQRGGLLVPSTMA
jgi:3-isopropylmalate dehydratase small subunit